ncbi:UvrD-helicase domain-containing protein [Rhizobium sp. Root1204]|uniref:UvrD-helicase domain-containing protein n=1 Tax=Rhizobium sp. Root1204 TaxID=1736428 RepID=UPI0007139BA5|nr:UvrD-helicase domain-containing protein [Rhizobium sp. Root1204]KQV41239.1 DNA helicase UvrD [Rhizobium sp. Root1204]
MPPDLLTIERGSVVAPAGCGKTELLARALTRHTGRLPVLVLTHTNAGVMALRTRLNKSGVSPSSYKLTTIDGWSMRLITLFPHRSSHDPGIMNGRFPQYGEIRRFAANLIESGHLSDIIKGTYSRVLIDEYQDCSTLQHRIAVALSQVLPTCVVGDPMQAIFGFDRSDPLPDWDRSVLDYFQPAGFLNDPHRWLNAGTAQLGHWLLSARTALQSGVKVDIRSAPPQLTWIPLDGSNGDHPRMLAAGRMVAPTPGGTVLIMGDSRNPSGQQRFASQVPGAITVESVDLKDLVTFAERFQLNAPDATRVLVEFAQQLMTNLSGPEMLQRLDTLRRGQERKPATEAESAALAFEVDRSYSRAASLLSALNKQGGVRVYRPAVFRGCLQSLGRADQDGCSFAEAAIATREQNRLAGRALPNRAVGSTLLLKGLEADVAVILNADELDTKHLYVALTRGSRQVVVCSKSPLLG